MIFTKKKCAICKQDKYFVYPRRFYSKEAQVYMKSQNPMCRKCARGFKRVMKGK